MAIVRRTKYTRVRARFRGALPSRRVSPKFRLRACVYFARPTVAIANIRDYSESNQISVIYLFFGISFSFRHLSLNSIQEIALDAFSSALTRMEYLYVLLFRKDNWNNQFDDERGTWSSWK